jgi:hypothetical protein
MAELKTKQKKVRVLNQKGKVFRQQDPLLAVVQWGVNHMVRPLQAAAASHVTPHDSHHKKERKRRGREEKKRDFG